MYKWNSGMEVARQDFRNMPQLHVSFIIVKIT